MGHLVCENGLERKSVPLLPEEKARVKIDKQLRNAGWDIVARNEYLPNSTSAVKEALMRGNTESDYLLFIVRNYEEKQFDYLIAVIFGNDFEVAEAYKVPHDVIGEYFPYKEHQNGVVVTLGSNFIQDTRVEDITYIFR